MTASIPARRGRPPRMSQEQRSEAILDAAARLFAAEGYRRTDVQQIADRAGVGKGTVYRLFPTKEALFMAAVEHTIRKLRAEVHTAVDGVADPLERIRIAIRTYLAYFDRHPWTVELFIQERAEFRESAKPLYFVSEAAGRADWIALLEALAVQGRLAPLDPETVFQVLSDLLYGTVFAHRLSGRTRPLAERADALLLAIFHGVLADES